MYLRVFLAFSQLNNAHNASDDDTAQFAKSPFPLLNSRSTCCQTPRSTIQSLRLDSIPKSGQLHNFSTMLHVARMLRMSCRNLLRLASVSMSVAKFESGIPSVNDIKKPDDYHSSKYTILGSKRKDPMHYTDRKVGRGYWHFSNTIFHSRPKIHPRSAKGIKQNLYIIFSLLLGLCIDYNCESFVPVGYVEEDCINNCCRLIRLGYQIKKFATNFHPEAADYDPRKTGSMNSSQTDETVLNNIDTNDNGKK